jgi:alkylation response protein AidB-like acyl-CoA dehydrogenase
MTMIEQTLDTPALTDDRVRALATRVGQVAARFDAEHDRDATFVTEAYDEMHACGYLRLPVPTELGGLGASMRQVVLAEESWAATRARRPSPRRCTCT